MKTSILYKAPTLLATLFFIGIVASAYTLFLAGKNPGVDSLFIASILIAVTFLLGIVTIYILTTRKNEKVVYVEKSKQAELVNQEIVTEEIGQLNINHISLV